ncbi:uroporphyrinogen-III synthase [Emcibacter nanhaiensis]|uniref:Uroporphyrinogen-III synthase n=1 Tax=Emcibacter nanhaiensis TaxID=1505037 RepID=A0A501PM08_9PROT|nr:uroporphyrinogen-III synthase [Emcibacter nanhaiensis]TPD61463.1 uroporphyrinogen-III synthase [Emcibacter nanhaiensis]
MRFLLTRPLHDSRILAHLLEARDHEAVIEPMMEVRCRPFEPPTDPTSYQAVIFTSANGVRAFRHHFPDSILPVYAVGPATATAAREAGFSDITSGSRDVEKLAQLIANDPELDNSRPVLHVAGTHVAGELKKLLQKVGIELERWVLYEAEKVNQLSGTTLEMLDQGKIDAIPFFSPRTARIFLELVRAAGREETLNQIKALCLSAAILDVIQSVNWQAIRVAPEPNQNSLFREINIELEEI